LEITCLTFTKMVALPHDTLVRDLQAKISELAQHHDAHVDNLQAHVWELTEHMCAIHRQMVQLHQENMRLKSLMADHKSSDVSTEFGDREPHLQSCLSDSAESEHEVVEVIDSDADGETEVVVIESDSDAEGETEVVVMDRHFEKTTEVQPSSPMCESITTCASSVAGKPSVKVQWKISHFSVSMNKKLGRDLVSPDFDVGNLAGLKLQVAPENTQVSKRDSSRLAFKKLVTEGPFYGCLTLKIPNAPKSPVEYHVSINNHAVGPFTNDFSDHCSAVHSGLGVNWLQEKNKDGSLLVGVDIVLHDSL